jgi:hypothetical protein
VRPMFNDWEDHWWPQPMAETVQQRMW